MLKRYFAARFLRSRWFASKYFGPYAVVPLSVRVTYHNLFARLSRDESFVAERVNDVPVTTILDVEEPVKEFADVWTTQLIDKLVAFSQSESTFITLAASANRVSVVNTDFFITKSLDDEEAKAIVVESKYTSKNADVLARS